MRKQYPVPTGWHAVPHISEMANKLEQWLTWYTGTESFLKSLNSTLCGVLTWNKRQQLVLNALSLRVEVGRTLTRITMLCVCVCHPKFLAGWPLTQILVELQCMPEKKSHNFLISYKKEQHKRSANSWGGSDTSATYFRFVRWCNSNISLRNYVIFDKTLFAECKNNNTAAVWFGLTPIAGETLELDAWNTETALKWVYVIYRTSTFTNMATMRNVKITDNKFNINRIRIQ